jgi:DNA-binding transcriptional MocR family regulator
MSLTLIVQVLDKIKVAAVEKLLLIDLAERTNRGGVCYPSIRSLAARMDRSYEWTRAVLRRLERKGLIKRISRFADDGRQTSNGYVLTLSSADSTGSTPPVDPQPPHEEPPKAPQAAGCGSDSKMASQEMKIIDGSHWLNRVTRHWLKRRHPGSGIVHDRTAGSYRARVEEGGRWFDLGQFPSIWEAHDRYIAAIQHPHALLGGKLGREVLR